MLSSKKKKVIAAGLWLDTCSLTRVIENVLQKVSEEYEVKLVGIGYTGLEKKHGNITVLPCNVRGGDMHGVRQLDILFEEDKPDAFFLCCDLALMQIYNWVINKHKGSFKSILYVPIDGSILNPKIPGFLPPFDHVVLYNQFGKQEMENALEKISETTQHKPLLHIIPHGIDSENFYPLTLEEKSDAYQKLTGRTDFIQTKPFIFLNANRPHLRKRIDLTVAGFSLFAKDKPANVLLYLHHARTNKQERDEILELLESYQIRERVLLSDFTPKEQFFSDKELNELYNICAVGVNTSMGEGWGLVSFEHAATGAAQIVPDNSASGELWRDHGYLIPGSKNFDMSLCNSGMKEVNAIEVAKAFEKVYLDKNYRNDIAKKGFEMVRQPKFEWVNIQQDWVTFFKNVV